MTAAPSPQRERLLGWYQSFFGGTGTDPNAGLNPARPSSSGAEPLSDRRQHPQRPVRADRALERDHPAEPDPAGASRRWAAPSSSIPAAAQLDMPGASADYKNLFALYSGLNTLYAIATEASGKNVSSLQLSQLSTAFDNGMTQLSKYLGQTSFSKLKLDAGDRSAAARPPPPATPAAADQLHDRAAEHDRRFQRRGSGVRRAMSRSTSTVQLGGGRAAERADQPRRHGRRRRARWATSSPS